MEQQHANLVLDAHHAMQPMGNAANAKLDMSTTLLILHAQLAQVCHHMDIAHHVQQVMECQQEHAFNVKTDGMEQGVDYAPNVQAKLTVCHAKLKQENALDVGKDLQSSMEHVSPSEDQVSSSHHLQEQ